LSIDRIKQKTDIEHFSKTIENLVDKLDCSYMDAILYHCERNEIEFEVASKLINNRIKTKIQLEAESLHFLPKENRLI
jgi:predicted secreted protein